MQPADGAGARVNACTGQDTRRADPDGGVRDGIAACRGRRVVTLVQETLQEPAMTWTAPAFVELRFGFEVTMYVQNR